eukprot:g59991.t1
MPRLADAFHLAPPYQHTRLDLDDFSSSSLYQQLRSIAGVSCDQHVILLDEHGDTCIIDDTLPAGQYYLAPGAIVEDARSRDCKERAQQILQQLPKTELHLHLDGSLTVSFMLDAVARRRLALPFGHSPLQLRWYMQHLKRQPPTPPTPPHHPSISGWPFFDFCNQLLQTAAELRDATCSLLQQLRQEHNVWLVELRFCPTLHTREGLSEEQAVAAVVQGFHQAQASCQAHDIPLEGGVLLCVLRSLPDQHGWDMLELASRWRGKGVLGLDVAGDEGRFPLARFVPLLTAARQRGVSVTCHAGEWGNEQRANLTSALDAQTQRIGHGLGLFLCPDLLQRAREQQVCLEVCLSAVERRVVLLGKQPQHPLCSFLRQESS